MFEDKKRVGGLVEARIVAVLVENVQRIKFKNLNESQEETSIVDQQGISPAPTG